MLPLRQLAPRRLRQPCAPAMRRTPSLAFSGSVLCAARQRPAALARASRHRQRLAAAEPLAQDRRVGGQLEPGPAPEPEQTLGPGPGTEGPPERCRDGLACGRPYPPPAPDRIAAIQKAVKDVAADRRLIASHKAIRHSLSRPLTTSITKDETHQLAAAERFFEHGYRFLYSAEAFRHHALNDSVPEIVVLGASNVGKSTFLNALLGRPGVARVSQRPGKTTLMNAYGVGPRPKTSPEPGRKGTPPPCNSLILVDTPGYGFKSRSSWGVSIIKYLDKRRLLRGAVVLLSSEKLKLLPEDLWVLRTLAELDARVLVVLTKADKGRADWRLRCSAMAEAVLAELRHLPQSVSSGWPAAAAAPADVFVTAAGMDVSGKLGNGGGVGGVRAAMLDMAGFALSDKVTTKADKVAYSGPVVSFDDIVWR